MDYYKFEITTGVADNEMLIAVMSILPFDTFVENETGFEAYLPADQDIDLVKQEIAALQLRFTFSFEKSFIKGENWNEAWESNFHPIQVGDFCGIRADFHPSMGSVEHELIITPKMAFGTGHHETTYMVIQLMKDLDFTDKKVLDYGCGTGVLAILASKLGAKTIDAIDIEQAAWQNTVENCETNNVQNVIAYKGELDRLAGITYGIVLANINRNVILESLRPLSHSMVSEGQLIISGILQSDRELVLQALERNGFSCTRSLEKNNWVAMQCTLT
ncbi:MAG: 50S ribosomal protein L11 methyltransferase [Bacteroidota bacterium]